MMGIVFLGTPFRGSGAHNYAETVGKLLSLVDYGNAEIYNMVSPSSHYLKDQLDDFVYIVKQNFIPIFCFYEQHKSNINRYAKMPLTKHVLKNNVSFA